MVLLFLLVQESCKTGSVSEKSPVDYVNPYMGNISHLLVPAYPTIHLPNSMLRVYPERGDFTGDLLRGLPVITTSHRGRSAFRISPFQGNESGLKPVISYSYDQEKINPYSYSVYLDEMEAAIDYAVSHQSGIYNMQFSERNPIYLILQSANGELKWDDGSVKGYQELENNTRVYIHLETDLLPVSTGTIEGNEYRTSMQVVSGRNASLVLKFPENTSGIYVKYGVSFISAEQAGNNLRREIPDFNFRKVEENGRNTWNAALGKMKVKGGSEEDKTVFYTSLYRSLERPVCISEDGRYFSAFDGQIHHDEGIPFYTDDWIWDSYRAHHPLNVLIDPRKEENIIHSFIRMAEQMENLWMPTFPEITGDSRRMNSNHGVATVLDAYQKGLRGFDLEKAYLACKGAITEKTLAPWSGKPAGELDQFYKDKGYIPALYPGEPETIPEVHGFEKRQPVAVTLGTAYDEWCLGVLAGILGKSEEAAYFKQRSFNYRNLFHPETRFFHPKDHQGEFIQPFDYVFSGGQGAREYYGENNAWIYRWDVQHNIADLIGLMGGREQFTASLDRMFSEPLGKSKYEFYAQLPDHTGNVGQFSMANEPSLHIPYLYNYAGQPWKTQKRIRTLLNQWFRNDLMGIPGDEDGGGMSSFVVFSQIGLYPVTPGIPVYNIGSPVFSETTVDLGNGKFFTITAENAGSDNKYIQSATLNGEPWNKPWITHREVADGGRLHLVMGNRANKNWGADPGLEPPSFEFNY